MQRGQEGWLPWQSSILQSGEDHQESTSGQHSQPFSYFTGSLVPESTNMRQYDPFGALPLEGPMQANPNDSFFHYNDWQQHTVSAVNLPQTWDYRPSPELSAIDYGGAYAHQHPHQSYEEFYSHLNRMSIDEDLQPQGVSSGSQEVGHSTSAASGSRNDDDKDEVLARLPPSLGEKCRKSTWAGETFIVYLHQLGRTLRKIKIDDLINEGIKFAKSCTYPKELFTSEADVMRSLIINLKERGMRRITPRVYHEFDNFIKTCEGEKPSPNEISEQQRPRMRTIWKQKGT